MDSPSRPWWMTGVIYHVYLRSFADSNGDGIGDLPGLIRRLDYLKGSPDSLGIDAIWVSPFFPSPDRDFGYDVADYTAVDPRYGTLADFDRLVNEAHRRGIRVLLDLVFNHTSDQHPWFLESRSSRTNPKRDWYVWRHAKPGGGMPNNWQSVFGGRAWQWDEATGQYYYHLFLKEQPDLNWHNPDVRAALMQVVRFWLDRGVDGFRLDVFNAWFERSGLPDNPPALGLRGFDRQRHVNDIDQPEMFDAMAELRGDPGLLSGPYFRRGALRSRPDEGGILLRPPQASYGLQLPVHRLPLAAAGFSRRGGAMGSGPEGGRLALLRVEQSRRLPGRLTLRQDPSRRRGQGRGGDAAHAARGRRSCTMAKRSPSSTHRSGVVSSSIHRGGATGRSIKEGIRTGRRCPGILRTGRASPQDSPGFRCTQTIGLATSPCNAAIRGRCCLSTDLCSPCGEARRR